MGPAFEMLSNLLTIWWLVGVRGVDGGQLLVGGQSVRGVVVAVAGQRRHWAEVFRAQPTDTALLDEWLKELGLPLKGPDRARPAGHGGGRTGPCPAAALGGGFGLAAIRGGELDGSRGVYRRLQRLRVCETKQQRFVR